MFFVYDQNGNKFAMTHKVDWRTALKTGRYFRNPPGTPEIKEEVKPEGEMVEGVEIESKKEIVDAKPLIFAEDISDKPKVKVKRSKQD
jgi:hypothetical protein